MLRYILALSIQMQRYGRRCSSWEKGLEERERERERERKLCAIIRRTMECVRVLQQKNISCLFQKETKRDRMWLPELITAYRKTHWSGRCFLYSLYVLCRSRNRRLKSNKTRKLLIFEKHFDNTFPSCTDLMSGIYMRWCLGGGSMWAWCVCVDRCMHTDIFWFVCVSGCTRTGFYELVSAHTYVLYVLVGLYADKIWVRRWVHTDILYALLRAQRKRIRHVLYIYTNGDPELSIGIFRNRLKTFLFSQTWRTTFLDLVVHL